MAQPLLLLPVASGQSHTSSNTVTYNLVHTMLLEQDPDMEWRTMTMLRHLRAPLLPKAEQEILTGKRRTVKERHNKLLNTMVKLLDLLRWGDMDCQPSMHCWVIILCPALNSRFCFDV